MNGLRVRLARSWEFTVYAVRNLAGYPLRSFLTTLGVVFGIASVVTMVGVGTGAQEQILREFDRLGIQNVILTSVKPPEAGQGAAQRQLVSTYGLTFRDMEQIEATVPGVASVLPVHSYTQRAWHGSRREEVAVLGVTPEHFEATRLRVARGRAFTADDERERRTVCVVHLQLLRALGWYGEPLGYKLMVGEQLWEVVGLLEDEEFVGPIRKALATPEQRETEVWAPYSTVLARIGTTSISRRTGSFEATNVELNQIVTRVARQEDVLPVARMVRTILERFHDQRDYQIVVPVELLAQRRRAQQVLNFWLLVIASISLLVGGIGIANIMLATVTERTREIGIRRAIGAKRRHIVSQFLTETVTLAGAGGVLGIFVGFGGVLLVRLFMGWEAAFNAYSVVVALAFSVAVGVLAGLLPAWRASRLDPIQALRYE